MDKTPPRAGHPLDGAAIGKVTGGQGRPLVAHRLQEYRSEELSAFQLIARSSHTGGRADKTRETPMIRSGEAR
jgi:hypothetical protein